MRHDYDLPPDWDDRSPQEKHLWYVQERCRRQSKQQGLAQQKLKESRKKRDRRILKARGYVSLADKR